MQSQVMAACSLVENVGGNDVREHTEKQAADMAYALGITLYLSNGRISNKPGGTEFDPGPRARPLQDHGSFNSENNTSSGG
jgi:hypothetical protein